MVLDARRARLLDGELVEQVRGERGGRGRRGEHKGSMEPK
jgi:hypothetical protein